MTDRELLELAAKAAGFEGKFTIRNGNQEQGLIGAEGINIKGMPLDGGWRYWNPLTDDGDALRLAVKLRLIIHTDGRGIMVCRTRVLGEPYGDSILAAETEYHVEGRDDYAKVRRAIVRAAAEIGKTK